MEKDLGALQWVADELGQVSDELVRTLLGFADDPSDSTRLRSGLTAAHQIHATLRLLAVPSAERLADEIEQTLQALLNAELAPSSDALQTLLAAVMELPAYLRRVGTERRESPHDVLMVLNDLRALRGATPLPPPPAELSFALDALHRDTGEQAPSASAEEMQLLRLARQRFQAELLGVLRQDASLQRLGQLVRVFALLAQRLGSAGHRLFWETAAAWVSALECGGVELDEQALALLRELDGELRAGIALEAGCYRRAPDVQICTHLLAGLAASAPVSERVVEAQRRHRLLGAAATRHDLGAVMAAIVALTDELGSVLQRLESTEGDAMASARTLREVEPELRRIAQLLAGLGFQDEQHMLQTQIERMADGFTPGPGLDDEITAVSAALLDLDQRLAARAVAAGGGGAVANRRHPLQRALEAVCREVGNALERVKQSVTDYLSSYGGVGVLGGLPDELHRLAGALQVAGLDAAADVLQGCRDHLVAIQADEGAAPAAAVIDTLADALGAVEYFLERFLIDGYASELILARAAATLHGRGAELLEPSLTTDELLSLVSPAPAEPAIAANLTEPQAPSPVPTQALEPVATQVPAEIDPEIVEVFVEEATEVLATIGEQLPQWSVAPEPGSALTELRRAFHTLKGSGRMVGAELIGELSWSVENLLNRVIDGTLAVTPALVDAVAACRELLPDLVTAFAHGADGQRDAVTLLRRRLDALARGEEPPAEVPVLLESVPVAVPSEPVPEPEPVGVDDVEQEAGERLRSIFGEELTEHLHALRAYLGAAEPAVVNQSLLRTLHTLRGSSCAAGNDTLALVLEPLDDMVHAAGEAAQALTAGQSALLTQLCDLLEHALNQPADALGLETRAQALRARIDDVFPRAARAAHPDARLVRFLHAALEKLFHAGSLLEAWRAGRDTAAGGHALLDELRAVHERAAQLEVTSVLRLARPLLDALEPAVLGGMEPSAELFGAVGAACEACLDVL
ncbi:MAG TPA: Hpt domain-containing protein, partial [Pseudomonadales bacterium]|nr:Hpt domain-containing protein [Pseudomonadales bacterium]